MRYKIILFVLFSILSVKAEAADCVSRLAVHQGATEEIISCLKEVNAENSQLRTRLDSKTESSGGEGSELPSGAVVAFDLPSGCPKGWGSFEPSVSRVIVGASSGQQQLLTHDQSGALLSARTYRESGGREMHQLTTDELPPLKFSISVTQAGGAGGDRYNAGGHDYPVVTQNPGTLATNSIGAGAPLGTMPPFISLFYCKKG